MFSLIFWHFSIGAPRTWMFRHRAGALVHIAVERFVDRNHHLYATLQTLGCNLWDTTERETVNADGWMTQGGLPHHALFHWICRHVVLWCHVPHYSPDVPWWAELDCLMEVKLMHTYCQTSLNGEFHVTSFPTSLLVVGTVSDQAGIWSRNLLAAMSHCSPLQHWTSL